MRQTEGSSPRNTWAHSLFCFVLFCSDIVICVISWLPLPVCLCRKLHSEMGEPHHVLCGQCVCSCRLIIDTHTPITHLYTPLHTLTYLRLNTSDQRQGCRAHQQTAGGHQVPSNPRGFQASCAWRRRHRDAFIVSCHISAFNGFIFRIIYLLPEAWKHVSATEETIVLLCV